MGPLHSSALVPWMALIAACAAPPPPVFISAPAEPPPVPAAPSTRNALSGDASPPSACGRAWKLSELSGDTAQVIVVCGSDVRRDPLDDSSPMALALSAGLEPVRAQVCACSQRLQAPPFVDLVFSAWPERGRVTVEANEVDDLDPSLGPPFMACVGRVEAQFGRSSSDACSARPGGGGGANVVFVYPARVDLAP